MHPKEILARYGIDPKKSLGQNFLFDQRLLERIAAVAELEPDDQVLEVGPGLGGLTDVLARRAARVVAVELDDRLLPVLQQQAETNWSNVTVIHEDILAWDPADVFETNSHYKVVANVPYYITGAILRHLLTATPRPDRLVLTVQKDVAERIVASPPKMSLLSVSVQLFGEARIAFNLASGSFYPKPKVASSVVDIDLTAQREYSVEMVSDIDRFFKIAKAGFSQKRKQLLNNLKPLAGGRDQVLDWCEQANVDGKRRAETLSIGEWISLFQNFPT